MAERINTSVVRLMRDKARSLLTELKIGDPLPSSCGICRELKTHLVRNGVPNAEASKAYMFVDALAKHVPSWPKYGDYYLRAYACTDSEDGKFNQARLDLCTLIAGSSYRELCKLTGGHSVAPKPTTRLLNKENTMAKAWRNENAAKINRARRAAQIHNAGVYREQRIEVPGTAREQKDKQAVIDKISRSLPRTTWLLQGLFHRVGIIKPSVDGAQV